MALTIDSFTRCGELGEKFKGLVHDDEEGYPIYNWCIQTFGLVGGNWDHYGRWFYFFDIDDLMWFLLRWGE